MAEGLAPGDLSNKESERSVLVAMNWDQPLRVWPRYLFYLIHQKQILGLFVRALLSGSFGEKYLKPLLRPLYETTYRRLEKRFSIRGNS